MHFKIVLLPVGGDVYLPAEFGQAAYLRMSFLRGCLKRGQNRRYATKTQSSDLQVLFSSCFSDFVAKYYF